MASYFYFYSNQFENAHVYFGFGFLMFYFFNHNTNFSFLYILKKSEFLDIALIRDVRTGKYANVPKVIFLKI
jgi:hypothetical protein